MMSFFKNLVGIQEEYIIGSFAFESSYKIVDNDLHFTRCEISETSIKYIQFKTGYNIEIKYFKTSTKTEFYGMKMPYTNSQGDIVYELSEKTKRVNFFLILYQNRQSMNICAISNPEEGWLFSNVSMHRLVKKEPDINALMNKINEHLKTFCVSNKFLLEIDPDVYTFMIQWQIYALDEIPLLPEAQGFSGSLIFSLIDEFRLDFIKNAPDKFKKL